MSNWEILWDPKQVKVTRKSTGNERSYLLVQQPTCHDCGNFLIRREICWDFKRHENLANAEQTFQLGKYYPIRKRSEQDEVDSLSQHIIELKDNNEFAEPIGMAMAMSIVNRYKQLMDADFLIPIPSFGIRENHVFHLCKIISEHLESIDGKKIPVLNGLKKIKNMRLHLLNSYAERVEAVKNMFEKEDGLFLLGKDVILVDDLLTSGDTKHECIRILKENGAKKVWVYVAAGNV